MTQASEQPRADPDPLDSDGEWMLDGRFGGYRWWDGQRYTMRATWNGSAWSLDPIAKATGLQRLEEGPSGGQSVFALALFPAVIGWLILPFVVMLIGSSVELGCTARHGDAYQDCVRGDDLAALRAQGTIMGFATAAFGLVLVGLVRQRSPWPPGNLTRIAVVVSGLLFAVSVWGWIDGVTGLWAPERPFPYDPISVARGNAIMLKGALVGLLIGVLLGVAITTIDRPPKERPTASS